MASTAIPIDSAVHITRPAGTRVKFVNQSSVDVYIDSEPGRLNSSIPGTTPSGTRIAANGGETQFDDYPRGGMWARAAVATTLEVQ